MLLQDNSRVISEPYQAQIGLRFPFLIIESKGGTAGGNMVGAQNQAAVDGACAVNILEDLRNTVAQIIFLLHDSRYSGGSTGEGEQQDKLPIILFSVTTEGPLHEIWVHYRLGEAYHMTCYRAWRMTWHEDAWEFVQVLAKIVEWGKKELRESILALLEQIERPVLEGILTG